MAEKIEIEVAYAEPGRQVLRRIALARGATVADAIEASGIVSGLGLDAGALTVGIWSRPARHDTLLEAGDRVELYRPLKVDPKEARRRRAERAGR
ncbi:RnfH family protein [Dokdonella sp.]|uniref:RnfH family protein n=1 Tax=Dokdonella sp. TaxID=2291710 RepID=UPI0031BF903C|nr:RnfH family protein [Dokdonella sp.]